MHQCRKGLWQRLFIIFCTGSGTEAYWGEAKRAQLLASVKDRSHRVPFCLGSDEPEAIEPTFWPRFSVPPEAI